MKVLDGRASMQDLTFAKEYRGSGSYRPGACVPALELTRCVCVYVCVSQHNFTWHLHKTPKSQREEVLSFTWMSVCLCVSVRKRERAREQQESEKEPAVNSYSSWCESNYSLPTLLLVWLHSPACTVPGAVARQPTT